MTKSQVVRLTLIVALVSGACAKKAAPVTAPAPPPAPPAAVNAPPPAPPRAAQPVEERLPVPAQPVLDDTIASRSLEDLNRDSPLKPVFFPLDSFDLDADGRAVADANAAILRRYPTWMVTLEGHCDERGTAEYNLALGERRAIAVRTYLVSLGISGERLRTVSYGKEFPFDPGHTDDAWSKNRRAHFVITAN